MFASDDANSVGYLPNAAKKDLVNRLGFRRSLPFFYGAFLIYPAFQVCYLSLTNSDIAAKGASSACKTMPS